MSLTSLVDEAIAVREPQFLAQRMKPVILEHAHAIASKYHLDAPQLQALQDDLQPLAIADPKPTNKTSNFLDALAKFIPGELVTLYLAAVAAGPAFHEALKVSNKAIFWFFVVVLSPGLFVLIMAAKRASAGMPTWPRAQDWPSWKLAASTVAFFVWALAVPDSPYLNTEPGKVVAAFLALFTSTILSIADPFMERRAHGV
ncbi:MAG TPA: hypothetical protein VEU32_02120 [Burkholderiales bacterium]|nr:hypothetical protein [Burkholderiales bacterium]